MPEQENTSYTQRQGTTTQNQGNLFAPNEYPVYTRKSIGYADGYSQFVQRTGGHKPDGTETTEKLIRQDAVEHAKSASPELLIDIHSNKFRRIAGYGAGKNTSSDAYEDPTYLIFDLSLMKTDSPLFREDLIKSFIDEYSDAVPELAERSGYWEEFVGLLFKIFPSDLSGDGSGSKKHYIEAIGGLDVLLNPIINYPEDIITFTLTEDIAMNLQYLSELYNNLIYSYDSHRYLIPDNLLRFNLRITVRDIRNMKKSTSYNDVITDTINEDISTFVYILHDCQFNFMKTKNFGAEIRRGGFAAASSSVSAGGTVDINFKSYSKIMAPQLIDNSLIIDFRERETASLSKTMKDKIYKIDFNGDYKSQDEVLATEKNNEQIKNVTYRSGADIITSSNQNKRPGGFQFPEINTSWRGFKNLINKEIIEVRDVIIKQIYTEVNQLVTAGERLIGNKLGFTLGKTNVYYYSLEEKGITRFAFMFEDLLRGESNVIHGAVKDLGKVWSNKDLDKEQKKDMISAIWSQTVQEMGDTAVDRLSKYYNPNYTFVKPLNQENVYGGTPESDLFPGGKIDLSSTGHTDKPMGKIDDSSIAHPDTPLNKIDLTNNHRQLPLTNKKIDLSSTAHPEKPSERIYKDGKYNEKYPSGDKLPDGQYNEKYPEGDKLPDGQYNEKYPSGDLAPDGQYNEKFPEGDLAPDGKYNEKYPSGDLAPDGQYNMKYPSGDLAPDGQYNEKYPEGDLAPNGQYNQKYPSGDRLPDGKYNQKYPDGDSLPDGQYNQKYPNADRSWKTDVSPDGQYNEKYPKGDSLPDGQYNEKYPNGSVEAKGTYNEKYPKGDSLPDGQYNEKYPEGDRTPDGTYNEKFPEGDRTPDGKYNEKFPKGSVEDKGTYNQKFPEGDSLPEGQYNQKFPEGDRHPDGTPHNKQPKGSREEKGEYNEKPPKGNIYGKNKSLPPTELKLGNVNKNKRQ